MELAVLDTVSGDPLSAYGIIEDRAKELVEKTEKIFNELADSSEGKIFSLQNAHKKMAEMCVSLEEYTFILVHSTMFLFKTGVLK